MRKIAVPPTVNFCSQCGAKAAGNFCSQCGLALTGNVPTVDVAVDLVGDWSHETRYDVLLKYPEVRERLAAAASQATKSMTGEQFLDICDKAFKPFTAGIPVMSLVQLIIPFYDKIGINVKKGRSTVFPLPAGKAIVACLCSMARQGVKVEEVHPAADGVLIKSAIPSDFWSFAGQLLVTIEASTGGVQCQANAKIPGQLYDWGKSQKYLNGLMTDLEAECRGH